VRIRLPVLPGPTIPTALTSENSSVLLLIQPPEKFLKTRVGQNGFHRIESISQLVMTPGLVNEILAGMTGRHDLGPAFAAGHDVMSTCRNFSFTKHTRVGHKTSLEA